MHRLCLPGDGEVWAVRWPSGDPEQLLQTGKARCHPRLPSHTPQRDLGHWHKLSRSGSSWLTDIHVLRGKERAAPQQESSGDSAPILPESSTCTFSRICNEICLKMQA